MSLLVVSQQKSLKSKLMSKVLIIATSRKTRGGITSVIKAHEKGEQWKQYHCQWIETHIDKGAFMKIWMLLTGLLKYLIFLPGADIVHFHISEPNSAKRKRLFMPFALLLKKKTIVHFHAFSPETTINGPHRKIYEYLFTNADVVVVLSNYWKNAVDEKFNLGSKIRVIYNPCMIVDYPKHYEKTKSILYAGTLNKRKGYSDLIRAFALVAPKYPEWKVVLAGNGELEKAESLAKNLRIASQIEFLGWVSGEKKDKAYKEASVFCLPSYAEGFPMAVLDAWSYGLPVITTPVGGIPDVAKHGINMLLFNPGDIDSLADNIEKIIVDESLRSLLSKESKLLASTQFNLDKICHQLRNLYDNLVG